MGRFRLWESLAPVLVVGLGLAIGLTYFRDGMDTPEQVIPLAVLTVLFLAIGRYARAPRSAYLDGLQNRLRNMQALGAAMPAGVPMRTRDAYVDLALHPANHERPGAPRILPEYLERERLIVVLGEPGSGKTMLLAATALEMSVRNRLLLRRGPLPVLLQLREHAATIVSEQPDLAVAALSASWLDGALRPSWLRRWLRSGQCVVLLDALDEVPDQDRERVMTWIGRQVARYPGNSFVLTSRLDGYLAGRLPDALVLRIQRLSPEQIIDFLRHWYAKVESGDRAAAAAHAQMLIARVLGNKALLELAGNPLTLSMIAQLYRSRDLVPTSTAALYREICELLLFRRQAAKGLPEPTGLPGRGKEIVVQQLALHMMLNRKRDIPFAEARSVIEEPLRQTARSGRTTPAVVLHQVRANGLLVERGANYYAFPSLSMQSYLAAAGLGRRRTGLLVERVDDPWWRETILFWSADADATPIIEACLDSGGAEALRLAEECAEVALALSPEARRALGQEVERRRRRAPGAAPAGREFALAEFVLEVYAREANRLIAEVDSGRASITDEDLTALLAARPAGAETYLSAAVLARELGDDRAARYHYRGLVALAGGMAGRHRESAADLYLAALTVGKGQRSEALYGYLRLLSGETRQAGPADAPGVAAVLGEEYDRFGSAALRHALPLLAQAEWAAGGPVMEALCTDAVLAAASTEYLGLGDGAAGPRELRGAWLREVERWRRARRHLINGLDEPRHLEITDESLRAAVEQISDLIEKIEREMVQQSVRRELRELARTLGALRGFARRRSFEERENVLNSARRAARRLRADIRDAPTAIGVELIEPVAARIEQLADGAYRELVKACPATPAVSLALERASRAGDVVTVQVKVTNAVGSAPVEEPALLLPSDAGLFTPRPARIELPAIRGGTSHIALARLALTGEGRDVAEFPLPFSLRYRPRLSGRARTVRDELPVRVSRPEDYTEIRNPYQEGALGRPVQRQEMFYGRDELIDSVRRRLREATSPGAGVAIFGQKRAGKSSIRLHLVRRLRELDGLPVVDIGNIGDLSPVPGEVTGTRLLALLMWRILDGANEEMKRVGAAPLLPPELRRADFLASPDPVYDCKRLFDGHRAGAPGQPALTVLIDEFQYVEDWIARGLVPDSFLKLFKALIELQLFHLVVVGQAEVARLIRADPNVFGVFGTERVSYLAAEQARRLIEEPIALDGGSRYRERAVHRILELTGGSAFYIQRFCYHLVDYMNAHRCPLVTEADIECVRADWLDRLEAKDFDNLASGGGAGDVLPAIARAARHGRATLRGIAAEYRGDGPVRDLVEDLVSRDVVSEDRGTFRIVVGIYRDWLLKYDGAHADGGSP